MAFADVVYARQDSFGLKSWASYAVNAGVSDSSAFAQCVAVSTSHPRVEQNLALGRRIGIQVTPTVMVNSWSLPVPPREDVLEALAKSPVSGETMSKVSMARRRAQCGDTSVLRSGCGTARGLGSQQCLGVAISLSLNGEKEAPSW